MTLPRSSFYADTGCKEKDPAVAEIKSNPEICPVGADFRQLSPSDLQCKTVS